MHRFGKRILKSAMAFVFVAAVSVTGVERASAVTLDSTNSCPDVGTAAWTLAAYDTVDYGSTSYGMLRLYYKPGKLSDGSAGTYFCSQIGFYSNVSPSTATASLTSQTTDLVVKESGISGRNTPGALLITRGCVLPSGSITVGGKVARATLASECHGDAGFRVRAINVAKDQLGIDYLWGGETPSAGFDCSGLVMYSFNKARHPIGVRTSAQMYAAVDHISKPVPGDLVFFGTPVHHVGIVVGNNKMIDAPHTGAVVRYDTISTFGSTIRYGRP